METPMGASTTWWEESALHSPPVREARMLPATAPSPPERLFVVVGSNLMQESVI